MEINDILNQIRIFNKERDWDKFHSGDNLAKSICIESSELLEVFQWSNKEKSIDKVKEELADVLLYCFMMADHYNLDIPSIMIDKLNKNKEKYPVDKCKGISSKYDELK